MYFYRGTKVIQPKNVKHKAQTIFDYDNLK